MSAIRRRKQEQIVDVNYSSIWEQGTKDISNEVLVILTGSGEAKWTDIENSLRGQGREPELVQMILLDCHLVVPFETVQIAVVDGFDGPQGIPHFLM